MYVVSGEPDRRTGDGEMGKGHTEDTEDGWVGVEVKLKN